VKHAGDQTLDSLEPLLDEIRGRPGLKEKKRGTFYRRSDAFLHFHEDEAGIFADVKGSEDWERFPVNTAAERRIFLEAVTRALRSKPKRRCCG
jgi:hypothetical protein